LSGLRDGLVYVRMKNYTRGNGWSLERPFLIMVKDNGEEKQFEFIPHGEPIKLPQLMSREN
jgi:hypothetical protein